MGVVEREPPVGTAALMAAPRSSTETWRFSSEVGPDSEGVSVISTGIRSVERVACLTGWVGMEDMAPAVVEDRNSSAATVPMPAGAFWERVRAEAQDWAVAAALVSVLAEWAVVHRPNAPVELEEPLLQPQALAAAVAAAVPGASVAVVGAMEGQDSLKSCGSLRIEGSRRQHWPL